MDIFISVFTYCAMIAVAFLMKKKGMMTVEHGRGLSTLVLNFTLPCAIFASFRGFDFNPKFLLLALVGLAGNVIIDLVGYLIGGKDKESRMFWMLCMTGFNIGCFSLPFASSFIGESGTLASTLYDSGNCIMCVGLNLTIVQLLIHEESSFSFKKITVSLIKRPAFTVFIVVIGLLACGVKIPKELFDMASAVGKANGPMSMFMIGLLADISFKKEYLKTTAVALMVRLLVCAVLAFVVYHFSFLPYEMRKAAVMVSFSPISSATTAYLAQYRCRTELSAFINTVSIAVSMVCIILVSIIL